MLASPTGAYATDVPATPDTLASAFAAASGGDTIRLAAGDYGAFEGSDKPGNVTLAPAPAASATIAPILSGASDVTFDGLTIAGAYVGDSHNIVFRNSRFTGMT